MPTFNLESNLKIKVSAASISNCIRKRTVAKICLVMVPHKVICTNVLFLFDIGYFAKA